VGHYTRLAVVGVRFTGVVMFVYGAPMLVYSLLAQFLGGAAQPGAHRAALLGWGIYLVVGTVLYALSAPLARVIAHDLDAG
jgi:hypothetical protein